MLCDGGMGKSIWPNQELLCEKRLIWIFSNGIFHFLCADNKHLRTVEELLMHFCRIWNLKSFIWCFACCWNLTPALLRFYFTALFLFSSLFLRCLFLSWCFQDSLLKTCSNGYNVHIQTQKHTHAVSCSPPAQHTELHHSCMFICPFVFICSHLHNSNFH